MGWMGERAAHRFQQLFRRTSVEKTSVIDPLVAINAPGIHEYLRAWDIHKQSPQRKEVEGRLAKVEAKLVNPAYLSRTGDEGLRVTMRDELLEIDRPFVFQNEDWTLYYSWYNLRDRDQYFNREGFFADYTRQMGTEKTEAVLKKRFKSLEEVVGGGSEGHHITKWLVAPGDEPILTVGPSDANRILRDMGH